jgi:hypothetical protein
LLLIPEFIIKIPKSLKMKPNKFILILLSICQIILLNASTQSYVAVLNASSTNNNIRVVDITSITFGTVDRDYIQLNKIPGINNGDISFSISSSTGDVNVGFEDLSTLDKYYFKFANNAFQIFINNTSPSINTNTVLPTDNFKIVKCGGVLKFYKNNQLLYISCLTNQANDLVHKTNVISAVDINLGLNFNNDIGSSCEGNIISNISPNARRANDELHFVKLLPKKEILLNILDQSDKFVKQINVRTDENGNILNKSTIENYYNERYKIVIVSAK